MSLRDALLKAGAVNKKQAKKAERELKRKRKAQQGSQERRTAQKARQKAERAQKKQQHLEQAVARRQRREAIADLQKKATEARGMRVRQVLRKQGVQPAAGPIRFHHRAPSGNHLVRQQLSVNLARALREGRCGLAALQQAWSDQVEYRVVNRTVAEDLRALAPDVVVMLNDPLQGEPTPDLGFIDDFVTPSELDADALLSSYLRQRRVG